MQVVNKANQDFLLCTPQREFTLHAHSTCVLHDAVWYAYTDKLNFIIDIDTRTFTSYYVWIKYTHDRFIIYDSIRVINLLNTIVYNHHIYILPDRMATVPAKSLYANGVCVMHVENSALTINVRNAVFGDVVIFAEN